MQTPASSDAIHATKEDNVKFWCFIGYGAILLTLLIVVLFFLSRAKQQDREARLREHEYIIESDIPGESGSPKMKTGL